MSIIISMIEADQYFLLKTKIAHFSKLQQFIFGCPTPSISHFKQAGFTGMARPSLWSHVLIIPEIQNEVGSIVSRPILPPRQDVQSTYPNLTKPNIA